jgi:LacI family transcriptional regulator
MERIAAPDGARHTVQLDAAIIERDSCGRPR